MASGAAQILLARHLGRLRLCRTVRNPRALRPGVRAHCQRNPLPIIDIMTSLCLVKCDGRCRHDVLQRTRARRTPRFASRRPIVTATLVSRACERVWVATSPSGARAALPETDEGRASRPPTGELPMRLEKKSRRVCIVAARRNERRNASSQILPGDRTHERRALSPDISYCGFHFDVCSARFRLRSEAV